MVLDAVRTCPFVGAVAALTTTVVVAEVNPLAAPAVRLAAVPDRLVAVPEEGVPNAPLYVTRPLAPLTLLPNAEATPVPRPLSPVETGSPVALVNVPEEGVPNAPPE